MRLDQHGQPEDLWLNQRLRTDRAIHEMLGLVKGMLIDGVISEREVIALDDWFRANPDALAIWPGQVLSQRLRRILADGQIDEPERQDLSELLEATVGVQLQPETNPTTTLPLDEPPPSLQFNGGTFLFTGKFVFGTRTVCEAAVVERGGRCLSRVNEQLNVLVIGCVGSRDWAHTSFGRKIEKAVGLKRKGIPVTIVGEHHWVSQLPTA